MDEKRRGGWKVCSDLAYDIRFIVCRELSTFGYLSDTVVSILRQQAERDHNYHKISGFSDGKGGPPAVKSRSKRG